MDFPPLDWSRIKTYPLRERPNKVRAGEFARPWGKGGSLKHFLDSLPDTLAARDLRALAAAIAEAVRRKKPVVVCMGAHVVKCGLGSLLVDLMRRGVVSCVATNGAGAIHDFELALIGQTSEDVQRGLDDGSFGMVEETGRLMNAAIKEGLKQGIGCGRALGETMVKGNLPNRELSILNAGVTANVPVTIHIAIGTDIIHQHPTCDGGALGEASYLDFQRFAAVVAALGDGGVVLNIGSAVVMPEVFLKALAVARNLGYKVENFTTATLDMIRQYRPTENIVRRPVHKGGKGYYIIGHHELMLPLLAASVIEQL
ncbi:MAG: deoxyhypusine synthase family protein [Verrucomicrobia bacterium]|nr:deoxyhypusine synthase family protein [Verrucomicrobiota bacterium]